MLPSVKPNESQSKFSSINHPRKHQLGLCLFFFPSLSSILITHIPWSCTPSAILIVQEIWNKKFDLKFTVIICLVRIGSCFKIQYRCLRDYYYHIIVLYTILYHTTPILNCLISTKLMLHFDISWNILNVFWCNYVTST